MNKFPFPNFCRHLLPACLLLSSAALQPAVAGGNVAVSPVDSVAQLETQRQQKAAAAALAGQLQAMTTLRAGFIQRVYDPTGEIVDESSGWMAWQHPDRFRWEVLNPMSQSILIDGQQYYQYDRDLDQLLVQPLSDDVAMLPRLLLSGSAADIENRFLVERLAAQAGAVSQQHYGLKARDNSGLFSEVEMAFAQGRLTSMQVVDELGQRSEFHFAEQPAALPQGEALFQLNPHPDTEVIYQ